MNFVKPHYRWNGEKYIIVTNDVGPTKVDPNNVPAWMRAKSTGATIGNIDHSDLKPPKLKMLAGMSPEVMDGVAGAVPGNFWMTIFNLNLGKEVTGSLI